MFLIIVNDEREMRGCDIFQDTPSSSPKYKNLKRFLTKKIHFVIL